MLDDQELVRIRGGVESWGTGLSFTITLFLIHLFNKHLLSARGSLEICKLTKEFNIPTLLEFIF